ncbi:MAG: triose-phosphate isomerase [Bacteroidales bacterium]|nr:triose-phosphate isomerase [Bacteroidales bacterium]
MREKIVAGNWKMNTDLKSGIDLAKEISIRLKHKPLQKDIRIIIAPPFTHLSQVQEVISSTSMVLAAQNCASESSGAFTGEVSASMLYSTGARAVIIGHSERRALFAETSEQLARKIDLALEAGLQPIFCCGESLEERKQNKQNIVVEQQLTEGLFHLTIESFERIIIAYEPVWAIGTGLTASPEQAQEMHQFIRNSVQEAYGKHTSDKTVILYGGSCKPSNAKSLFKQKDVDGGLIGGASLNAGDFLAIARSFEED